VHLKPTAFVLAGYPECGMKHGIGLLFRSGHSSQVYCSGENRATSHVSDFGRSGVRMPRFGALPTQRKGFEICDFRSAVRAADPRYSGNRTGPGLRPRQSMSRIRTSRFWLGDAVPRHRVLARNAHPPGGGKPCRDIARHRPAFIGSENFRRATLKNSWTT
jgi:hypothetical protein